METELNRRSVWREFKFLTRIIKENLLSLSEIIGSFQDITICLFVEKRQDGRVLQLAQE